MSLEVRMVGAADLDAFVEHLQRVIPQSGEDGGPVFAPYAPDKPPNYEKMKEGRLAGWETPVGEPGWRRAWVAFDGSRVVGDIELDGGAIDADLHRATLGMAIQREHRGQGLGSRLVDTVIGWAREQGLEYIDLGVFSGNERAERLYRKYGFKPWGTHRDAFRVGDRSLDDIQMVLKL